ncbi:MAG: metal ABC transporter permease [Planctomycetia bacterium]
MESFSLFDADGMHAWAVATAAVVAAGCALVGTLLVVRRMSLVGDCVSHAVLPGVAIAVLAGGRPGGPLVLCGAAVAAVVSVWLARLVHTAAGIAEDAAAGVSFTTLFAAGVLLVTASASRVDLDPGCVLHGVLEMVPFDTVPVGGVEVPRAFLTGVAVLVVLLVGLVATWNLQVSVAFDSGAAEAAGLPVRATTTSLLVATALVTVAGFEAVGAILVVAMLVVPAATAELLSRRLHRIAALAVVFGITAAVVGYRAAWRWNTNAAGMIAVVLGIQYVAAVVLAPDGGLLSRVANRGRFHGRVLLEDRLAAWWRTQESSPSSDRSARQSAYQQAADRLAVLCLGCTGRLGRAGGRLSLTPRGRREADTVVRSHRLWEAWLGKHADLPLDHLHPPAEWIEHHIGADLRRRIEVEVGAETIDPHGRAIPPEPDG